MYKYVRVAPNYNRDLVMMSHLYYCDGDYLATPEQYNRICRRLRVSKSDGLVCCPGDGEWHTVLEMP